MLHAVTDHETIRRWAEARGMEPACCADTEQRDPGEAIRLQPCGAARSALRRVSWHEWFRTFDRYELVLLIENAARQPSALHRIVPRARAASASLRRAELAG
jgi:hypothetical protein